MLLLCTVLLAACRDDTVTPWYDQYPVVTDTDHDLDPCDLCSLGCRDVNDDDLYDYTNPVFNPQNGEEFAYLRENNHDISPVKEVWIMNGRTGETHFVSDNVLGYLDWSPTGWLIFMDLDRQVYKIEPDGSNRIQLTSEGDWNRGPFWEYSGESFTVFREQNEDNYLLHIGSDGLILDTITTKIPVTPRGWNEKDQIAQLRLHVNLRDFEVGYFDYNDQSAYVLYEEDVPPFESNKYFGNGVTWINSETILWVTRHIVGTTNIQTGETDIILETPMSHFLSGGLGVNPAGTHALVGAFDRELIGVCQLDIQYRLYLIDLETGEERRIEIPE